MEELKRHASQFYNVEERRKGKIYAEVERMNKKR